jgi:outer membrane protein TolC
MRHSRPETPNLDSWRCRGKVALRLGAGAGALILASCADMGRIDREIDRLVESRSTAISPETIAPTISPPIPDTGPTESEFQKRPPTVNPTSSELIFEVADTSPEAVLSRLEAYTQIPPDAERLSLEDVLGISQKSSREYITAEEEYLLAAIRLLIERHRWGPRLFDDITAAIDAEGNSGDYSTALRVINELRVSQRLPYGGEVEARLITEATHQLSDVVGDRYQQSSALVLSANVPLLRNAGLIAQEDLIQAERDLVYAARSFEDFRRSLFVDIARDYFSLLAQQAVIANQEERLRSIMAFLERTQALVDAGRERPFQAKNVEQNVLTSRNQLISQREAYLLSLDRFKIRLGVPVERAITLDPVSLEIDDPKITVERAGQLALQYRLDYQNELDRIDDSRRSVANARNQLLPDLNTALSASFNTDDSVQIGGVNFDLNDADWRAAVTFGLPLDREIERLTLRSAMIFLERNQRNVEEFRDGLILEARRAVRAIDTARLSLRLQEQAVQINELRLEEILIKEDEVDAQTRLDAENELLEARNSRDQAIRDLRTAILQYLRITGQLRVARDGRLLPLEGMVVRLMDEEKLMEPEGLPPGQPPVEFKDGPPDPQIDPNPQIDGPAVPENEPEQPPQPRP